MGSDGRLTAPPLNRSAEPTAPVLDVLDVGWIEHVPWRSQPEASVPQLSGSSTSSSRAVASGIGAGSAIETVPPWERQPIDVGQEIASGGANWLPAETLKVRPPSFHALRDDGSWAPV